MALRKYTLTLTYHRSGAVFLLFCPLRIFTTLICMQLAQVDPLASKPSLTLFTEIYEIIAGFLFQLTPPLITSNNVEGETICCVKPDWHSVNGFMAASPELHRIGYARWVSVLTIRDPRDWPVVLQSSQLVRELRCLNRAFHPDHKAVLSAFPRLRAVSIENHDDVRQLGAGANRFAYQDTFTCLPQTLRHLEIRHAHGPDVNVIARIKCCCPELETLWLGRCTMFNRTPACQFWESFPFDHDSYISCEGTDAYASSLGQELSPLQHLKWLRLGIYLMPSTAVLAHRLFHERNLPAPPAINWQEALTPPHNVDQASGQAEDPQAPQVADLISLLHRPPEPEICKLCQEESWLESRSAEESGNQVLKGLVPGLRHIEWMDWFSPFHLGVSSCIWKDES